MSFLIKLFSTKAECHKDYLESAEYFTNPEKSLNDDIKKVEQAKDYISWIQSFSKKIVGITFLLYVVLNIAIFVANMFKINLGLDADMNMMYSEISETFRVVIGGYLIKAAVENSFKIGGNYLVGISDAKLVALREKYQFFGNVEEEGNQEAIEDPEYIGEEDNI